MEKVQNIERGQLLGYLMLDLEGYTLTKRPLPLLTVVEFYEAASFPTDVPWMVRCCYQSSKQCFSMDGYVITQGDSVWFVVDEASCQWVTKNLPLAVIVKVIAYDNARGFRRAEKQETVHFIGKPGDAPSN